jgi:hypothetical protein
VIGGLAAAQRTTRSRIGKRVWRVRSGRGIGPDPPRDLPQKESATAGRAAIMLRGMFRHGKNGECSRIRTCDPLIKSRAEIECFQGGLGKGARLENGAKSLKRSGRADGTPKPVSAATATARQSALPERPELSVRLAQLLRSRTPRRRASRPWLTIALRLTSLNAIGGGPWRRIESSHSGRQRRRLARPTTSRTKPPSPRQGKATKLLRSEADGTTMFAMSLARTRRCLCDSDITVAAKCGIWGKSRPRSMPA